MSWILLLDDEMHTFYVVDSSLYRLQGMDFSRSFYMGEYETREKAETEARLRNEFYSRKGKKQ